jgi:hypothetical protein
MNEPPPGDPGRAGPPGADLAHRLLAAAAAWLPAGRGDWGRAMLAELDQVRGRPARWAFALGAARACLMAPRAVRPAWHAIVVAGGAAAAGGAIHALAPGAGVIAAAVIPGLPALCVLAILARRPAGHVSGAGRVIQVIAVAAIAACAVLALRQDVLYPPPAAGRGGWEISLLFAVGLTGYMWLALCQPPALAARRPGCIFGLAASLIVAAAVLLFGQLGVPGTALGAALLAVALATCLAARHAGLLRNLIAAALWQAVLLTGPALFIVQVTATSAAIRLDARDPQTIAEAHSQGAASVLAWAGQDNLGGAVFIMTYICLVSLVVGITSARLQQQAARRPPAHPVGQDI